MNRRRFFKQAAVVGGALIAVPLVESCSGPAAVTAPPLSMQPRMPSSIPPTATSTGTAPTLEPATAPATVAEEITTQVALVKTQDRADGVRRAVELLNINPIQGKRVLLKPNFNSADEAPGSTHLDVLRALIAELYEMGAQAVTVGDRSGMGDTRQVMEQKGVFDLAREMGFEVVVFDELDAANWQRHQPGDSHWSRGFYVPRLLAEAGCVVETCNLKTHRFGGHFTLSLKNSVGFAAKTVPGDGYNYMNELHGSQHQRRMIAEINTAYSPALIVLDGVEALVSGGPDVGQKVTSEVVLAGTDRIAIDAVGVAILRLFGTTPEVSRGHIFDLEQIARAVELGLGVDSPSKIQWVTADADSADYAARIQPMLAS